MDSASEVLATPLFADIGFNADGSLKQTGKQNVKFRHQKVLSFRARPKLDENGKQVLNAAGKPVFDIDPKTGLPFKDAFEEVKEFVRVETKGDTNIKDDVANDMDRRQHYRQYKAFRDGKIPDGNPIENFDFIQPPTCMEMHMHGIHTIEQVATMPDLVCEQMKDQSGFEVRSIAAQWIKLSSPHSLGLRMTQEQSEIIRLRDRVKQLEAGGRGLVQPYGAAPEVPDAPIQTMELTPEQMAKPKRERKV